MMNFRQLNEDVLTGDCPYCKNESFKYKDNDQWMFLCHNCQRNTEFYKVEDYVRNTNSSNRSMGTTITPVADYSSLLRNCEVLSDLPSSHHAVQYARNRGFPEWVYSNLYYNDMFGDLVRSKGFSFKNEQPKLIIPFYDEDGKMFGLQARALDDSTPKYVTIMFNENEDKIFGRDRVDMTKPFNVVEGPIDSFFVNNCVAVAGADMLPNKYSSLATICLDNEPRNKQIVDKMHKYLQQGFKVVVWPDSLKEKDINDIVLSNQDPNSIIIDNTYTGLQGTVRLNSWKRC